MQGDCALVHVYGVERALISDIPFTYEADLCPNVGHFPHDGGFLTSTNLSFRESQDFHKFYTSQVVLCCPHLQQQPLHL